MKFTSHGRQYEIDRFGVINQKDARPFVYDEKYVSTYDTPEYAAKSALLQGMRMGFCCGAHGSIPETLLDYGYGNGDFMKFAKQYIPHVYGFDLTLVPVDGCYIMPQLVNVDVMTFWDALEHVPDLSFLADLRARTLVISLPYCHFHTEGKEWFDNNYKHRKPDEHLHHFNEHSLALLMSYYGWKTVSVSNHEDVIRTSAHGLPNILSMAFKKGG